jgi:hypothetical protein
LRENNKNHIYNHISRTPIFLIPATIVLIYRAIDYTCFSDQNPLSLSSVATLKNLEATSHECCHTFGSMVGVTRDSGWDRVLAKVWISLNVPISKTKSSKGSCD